MSNQSACLTLVTNAVVAWNTVYMQEVIKKFRLEGQQVNENDFVYVSPARFGHINPYGRYDFNVAKSFSRENLRPLRDL